MLSTFLMTVGAIALMVGLGAIYLPAAPIFAGILSITLGVGLWRAERPRGRGA